MKCNKEMVELAATLEKKQPVFKKLETTTQTN